MIQGKTALFIGHSDCFGVSERDVKNAIIHLIHLGVTIFLSGGQGRFDQLCARCVYELKFLYPGINNYLIIPYLSFHTFNREIFDEILFPEGFEKYHYKAAIPARNRYMVDHSSFAICYIDHDWGGAAQTYKRALKRKLKIINLSRYSIA